MKRKTCVLTAQEIKSQGKIDLRFEFKPRGAGLNSPVAKGEDGVKRHLLEQTRALGGLVPDKLGAQYFKCLSCGQVSTSPHCCTLKGNRVQICVLCQREYGELLRIGECRCRQH